MKKRSLFKAFMLCLTIALFFCISVPAFAGTSTVKVAMKKTGSRVKKTVAAGTNTKCLLEYGSVYLMNNNVQFTTSRSSVATVSKSGVITAKTSGVAVITAKYAKSSAKITLTVKATPASQKKAQLRKNLVAYAKTFVGKLPYVYAGNSLKYGTDCSGFVHLIYRKFGKSVPRSAREFQSLCNIEYEDLQPGDVVVYKNGGHVAIYIGNDKVVHAKGSQYGTCKDSMWYGTPTGYVRFI